MRSVIIDDDFLDPQRRAAYAREAVRQGVPMADILKKTLLAKADALIAAAAGERGLPKKQRPASPAA